VAAGVLRASEQRLIVDPETDSPRDRKSRMTSALGRGAHWMVRLTTTPVAFDERLRTARWDTVPGTGVHVPCHG
jgi:hypothetical protein